MLKSQIPIPTVLPATRGAAWLEGYVQGWCDRLRWPGHPATFREAIAGAPTVAELYAADPDWQAGRGLLPEGCRPAGPKEGGAS